MQAMDDEPERPLRNAPLITSKTTGVDLELEPWPVGGGQVMLHLAMMECHTWHGIGGRSGRVRRPRRLTRQIPLVLADDFPSSSSFSGGRGPDSLRSVDIDDCRRHIGQKIKDSLRAAEEEYRCLTPAHWDEFVPGDAARRIAEHARGRASAAVRRDDGGGGTCEARVDISVRVEFVYSEPEELLLACVKNGGGEWTRPGRRRAGDGDGDAPLCSICFEEMSRGEAGEVTDLPGCTHGFHRGCIAAWFQKASTCPVCRRDQLQYLPPHYRYLHDAMKVDPDSLPDYL